jgi:8-amino-7-oxononanoate synthase
MSTPTALQFLLPALESLGEQSLLRVPAAPLPARERSFCSNDYLGVVHGDAGTDAPFGAGASRMVRGNWSAHARLEETLARWVRRQRALVFTSGYACNVGALAALLGPEDLVVSDALNHASLIDGMRLSRAQIRVVPHLDLEATAAALVGPARRKWVVTESYFGMDADSPDLGALRSICNAKGAALYVDEAHALGVLGPEGRGLCATATGDDGADVVVGTLGKAVGAQGAFVAGCTALYEFLWNRARSHVFSTGLSPRVATAAAEVVETLAEADLRDRVISRARQLREGMIALGLEPLGYGHVVPLIVGSAPRAMAAQAQLAERGFHVPAIRPPTVPPNTARLRFTVSAAHQGADIDALLDALQEVRGCFAS